MDLYRPNWLTDAQGVLELTFSPDPSSPEPLYQKLAAYIDELVASGHLSGGERMPPSRELAKSLGFSRNTVSRAYDALCARGVLEAEVGRGTFVNVASDGNSSREDAVTSLAWSGLKSARARAQRLPEIAVPPSRVEVDFRGGRVDVDALPMADLAGALTRALAKLPSVANEIDPFGLHPLREAIATRLLGRGIRCIADDLLLVSGAQQGLDLVARILVERGDAVAVEDPGYFGSTMALRAAEAMPIGVPVDESGIDTSALARVARTRRLKMVVVTPAAQKPTGVLMSAERRRSLLSVAQREQFAVLEDDYDAELRFDDSLRPALKTEDPGDLVIYLGTFSKSLFPGLRVGYLLAPASLRPALAFARFANTMQPSLLDQLVLLDLLTSDRLDRHIRKMRRHYAARRAALLESVQTLTPFGAHFSEARGGSALWLRLPDSLSEAALCEAAARRGIAVEAGATYALESGSPPALSLSFAQEAPERIREGVRRLREALEEVQAT